MPAIELEGPSARDWNQFVVNSTPRIEGRMKRRHQDVIQGVSSVQAHVQIKQYHRSLHRFV